MAGAAGIPISSYSCLQNQQRRSSTNRQASAEMVRQMSAGDREAVLRPRLGHRGGAVRPREAVRPTQRPPPEQTVLALQYSSFTQSTMTCPIRTGVQERLQRLHQLQRPYVPMAKMFIPMRFQRSLSTHTTCVHAQFRGCLGIVAPHELLTYINLVRPHTGIFRCHQHGEMYVP